MEYVIMALVPMSMSDALTCKTEALAARFSETDPEYSSSENTGGESFSSSMVTVTVAVLDNGESPPSVAMTMMSYTSLVSLSKLSDRVKISPLVGCMVKLPVSETSL